MLVTSLINNTILPIYKSKPQKIIGIEMTGFCGKNWIYEDLYIQMKDNSVLKIVIHDVEILDELPKECIRIKNDSICNVEGIRSIIDIYQNKDEPSIIILFDNNEYLEYAYEPGGSVWRLSKFDNDDIDEEYEENYLSIFTGKTKTWNELVKTYRL